MMQKADEMTAKLSQLEEASKKHEREKEELIKQRDSFKRIVDEISEKFGGINAVDEAIRLARIKEDSVAGLLQKLETVLESTESNLSCMKCMNIL